jgi:hypothetical protein
MSKLSDAKKMGRPATGIGYPVTVRLDSHLLAMLDAWATDTASPPPSRPEAIRRLLYKALS